MNVKMENQKTIIEGFTQIDAPGFPKIRTNHYLIKKEKLEDVQEDIESSLAFGQLGDGFLGKHECEINDMHYGDEINIPFFTEFRTVRDENKESLSRTYHFMKNNAPPNYFFINKKSLEKFNTKRE